MKCEICKKEIEGYHRLVPRPDMKRIVIMCWDCINTYCIEQVMKPTPEGMCVICKVNQRVNQGKEHEWSCCYECVMATAIID